MSFLEDVFDDADNPDELKSILGFRGRSDTEDEETTRVYLDPDREEYVEFATSAIVKEISPGGPESPEYLVWIRLDTMIVYSETLTITEGLLQGVTVHEIYRNLPARTLALKRPPLPKPLSGRRCVFSDSGRICIGPSGRICP